MAIVAVKLTIAKIRAGTIRRGTSSHGNSVMMRCDGDEKGRQDEEGRVRKQWVVRN
jgi:hypothetical protein